MYDTMTRHYCHVFRGTLSPFDEEWELQAHASAFGNDAELMEKFQAFKLVEEDQCECIPKKFRYRILLFTFVRCKDIENGLN